MKRPVFKAHLKVSVIPGEGALVISEDGARALHGKIYEELAPLIDGSRDADALVEALAGKVDAARVYYALMLLEKNGHLAESVPEIPPETAAFWHGMGIDPAAALEALRARRVGVQALGEVDAGPLRLALAELGVTVADGKTADFEAVLTDDYLRPELEALNAANLEAGRPWLLVKPVGHELWIGPLYVPGKTGCHHDRQLPGDAGALRRRRHPSQRSNALQRSTTGGARGLEREEIQVQPGARTAR